jgi:Tol biopolymer transport system component
MKKFLLLCFVLLLTTCTMVISAQDDTDDYRIIFARNTIVDNDAFQAGNPVEAFQSSIYIMDSDGSNVEKLVDFEKGLIPFPYYTHQVVDGQTVVVTVANYEDDSQELWLLNLIELELAFIANLTMTNNIYPGEYLSPTGENIAYVVRNDLETSANETEIYVHNILSGEEIQLTTNANIGLYTFSPSWSSDGSQIALNDYYGGIVILDADGNNIRRILDLDGFGITSPNWSPDGRYILFELYSDNDGYVGLYVVEPDGRNRELLTSEIRFNAMRWSPDARYVAGITRDDYHLGVVDAETGDIIYHGENDGQVNWLSLVWTPDGQQIVFAETNNGTAQIAVMNWDGSDRRLLTNPDDSVLDMPIAVIATP